MTGGLIQRMAQERGVSTNQFWDTLRATILSQDASNEELMAFCLVAHRYGLDPFLKEIHAFVGKGGKIQPILGVDGWIKIANEHPEFDGLEFADAVDEKGNVVSITCTVWRKDRRRPTQCTEYMAECRQPGASPVWARWPRRMLRHRAMIQAIRIAFGVSGIMEAEEAAVMDAEVVSNRTSEIKQQIEDKRRPETKPKPAAEPEPAVPPVGASVPSVGSDVGGTEPAVVELRKRITELSEFEAEVALADAAAALADGEISEVQHAELVKVKAERFKPKPKRKATRRKKTTKAAEAPPTEPPVDDDPFGPGSVTEPPRTEISRGPISRGAQMFFDVAGKIDPEGPDASVMRDQIDGALNAGSISPQEHELIMEQLDKPRP